MKVNEQIKEELWDAIYKAIGGKCITESAANYATDETLEDILPIIEAYAQQNTLSRDKVKNLILDSGTLYADHGRKYYIFLKPNWNICLIKFAL